MLKWEIWHEKCVSFFDSSNQKTYGTLVREGSEERRRFFDGMMSQLDRGFLENLLSKIKIQKEFTHLKNVYIQLILTILALSILAD